MFHPMFSPESLAEKLQLLTPTRPHLDKVLFPSFPEVPHIISFFIRQLPMLTLHVLFANLF